MEPFYDGREAAIRTKQYIIVYDRQEASAWIQYDESKLMTDPDAE